MTTSGIAEVLDGTKYEVKNWELRVNWRGHISVPMDRDIFTERELPQYVIDAIQRFIQQELEPRVNADGSPFTVFAQKRLEGLRPFNVDAEETVYYSKRVWAANAEEAESMVRNGEEDMYSEHIYHVGEFTVTGAEEADA